MLGIRCKDIYPGRNGAKYILLPEYSSILLYVLQLAALFVGISDHLYKQEHCHSDHSPLHIACCHGNEEAVSQMLLSGFNVNIVDEHFRTPLWEAISRGHTSIANLFLSKDNIDVNIVTSDSTPEINCQNKKMSVIMKAATRNDADSVIGICKHNPDLKMVDIMKRTPLHYACIHGNIDCVRAMLSCDVDVNARDKDRITPLYAACKHGHVDVVSALLEAGAKINNKTEEEINIGFSSKFTPLSQRYKVIKYAKYPLMAAIDKCHPEVVSLLISKGANVHIKLSSSRTPLHVACSEGTLDMVMAIVDKGADINAKDSYGQTPLFFCLRNGKFQIGWRVYRTNRIRGDYNDQDFESYLDSLETGNEIMQYLIKKGAVVDCKDSVGETPLGYSASTCRTFSTFILLKYGAKIEWRCFDKFPWKIWDLSKNKFPNANLFQLLVKHSYEFRKLLPTYVEKLQSGNLSSKESIIPLISEAERPLSLKDQCRLCIRNSLFTDTGPQFEHSVNTLSLPKPLVSFLMFGDLEEHAQLRNEIPEQL